MNSLLVYDYETTGVDPVRDRPVQFACVRTDLDLNLIGKPATLYCRPSPDHLPDPVASLVTGITPQLCEQAGLPELQFVEEVQRQLGAPGTISFGYNSIDFDDEVTRFMFWRNLIDPYAHEWKDGCGRWDLIRLVRATYALRPDAIEWPLGEQGRPSFKLERLSAANGLLHESAHDALSDVYATIALARLIKERQPQLYAHCFAMLDKTRAMQEMDVARKQPFIYVGRGCARAAGIRVMLPVAPHPTNRNVVIAWDLAKDPRQLLDIDAETLRRRLSLDAGERPEGFEPMPLHCIAANKSPAVFADLNVLSRERAAELGLDMAALLASVPVLLGVAEAVDLARLLQVAFDREPPECDAEEALYAGFVASSDRRMLDQLRSMDPANLAMVKPGFGDPRLDELFLRYKARHYPALLSQRELDKWEEYRYRKLVTGLPGSRTFTMVRAALARCRQALAESGLPDDPVKGKLLDEVEAYTNDLAAVIDPFDTAAPAPAPVAESAHVSEPAAPPPVPPPVPVQPDLFGGADVTPATRRAAPGRARPRRR